MHECLARNILIDVLILKQPLPLLYRLLSEEVVVEFLNFLIVEAKVHLIALKS